MVPVPVLLNVNVKLGEVDIDDGESVPATPRESVE
jgi:hypothetical protein